MEAKKLAKELEERKKKGNPLIRPQSAKTMNFGKWCKLVFFSNLRSTIILRSWYLIHEVRTSGRHPSTRSINESFNSWFKCTFLC